LVSLPRGGKRERGWSIRRGRDNKTFKREELQQRNGASGSSGKSFAIKGPGKRRKSDQRGDRILFLSNRIGKKALTGKRIQVQRHDQIGDPFQEKILGKALVQEVLALGASFQDGTSLRREEGRKGGGGGGGGFDNPRRDRKSKISSRTPIRTSSTGGGGTSGVLGKKGLLLGKKRKSLGGGKSS